jgi:Zn-finger nucleic acid-binding protein
MCQLKTSYNELKIIAGVKSQGVFLDKGVLNKMVFSSVVGYLDGGIYREGIMSAFF